MYCVLRRGHNNVFSCDTVQMKGIISCAKNLKDTKIGLWVYQFGTNHLLNNYTTKKLQVIIFFSKTSLFYKEWHLYVTAENCHRFNCNNMHMYLNFLWSVKSNWMWFSTPILREVLHLVRYIIVKKKKKSFIYFF